MNATLPAPAVASIPECTVVRPGAADAYWLITDLTEILFTSGAMDVVHTIVPPQGGPPAHVHRKEDELFYVVDGTFEFVFGDRRFTAGAGTALYLPRNVVHRFKNVGLTDGRLLVMVAPGGFSKFVATSGDICLDRSQLPQVGPATFEKLAAGCARMEIEMLPTWKADRPALTRVPVRELWVLGMHVKLLLTSEETAGAYSVAEITAAPGGFVPPHVHAREDEMFYVLSGTFEFELADSVITAPPGTFVHVPRQTLHRFRNAGRTVGKLLDVHTPGGFEKFFIEAGTKCDDAHQGPPESAPDMPRFLQICRKHGMEI